MEMTVEQKRALALMEMRKRAAASGGAQPQQPGTVEAQGQRLEPWPTQTPIPLSPHQRQQGRIASSGIGGIPVMDEASGGIAALSALLRGKPAGEAYTAERDKFRKAAGDYQQENPGSAAGMAIAGSLPLSLATGGIAPAATLTGRMGQGAAMGGGLGALTGFAGGEGGLMPRLESAAKVGVPSALIGGATPAVAEGLGAAGQWLGKKLVTGEGTLPAAQEARQAGYVIPPNMGQEKPSLTSKVLSGIGGKIKTQQAASEKNQAVTNAIAAKELGIEPKTALTEEVFKNVRAQAGKAYEAAKTSIPTITADDQFAAAIGELGGRTSSAAQSFPGIVKNQQIEDLTTALSSAKQFPPDAAIEVVKQLRHEATLHLRSMDDPAKVSLGMAQRHAADAIDDLVERNLQSVNPALVPEYRAARQLIAKSHDIEAATNAATGEVSARKLARLASKKPFTGGLSAIAKMGQAFPKAAQDMSSFGGTEAHSVLDVVGATGATMAGSPAAGAALLARPALRGTVLSNPYQNLTLGSGGANVARGAGAMNIDPRLLGIMSPALLQRYLSQTSNQPR